MKKQIKTKVFVKVGAGGPEFKKVEKPSWKVLTTKRLKIAVGYFKEFHQYGIPSAIGGMTKTEEEELRASLCLYKAWRSRHVGGVSVHNQVREAADRLGLTVRA